VLGLKNFCAFMAVVMVVVSLAGCQPEQQKELLVVEFKADTTLRYKLVSERNISIDLDPTGVATKGKKSKPQEIHEKLEMVIAYTPVELDPYGLSTISATCESAKVTRKASKKTPRDAVEYLAGQTFTFKVSPVGKIEDYSEIEKIVLELGEKAISEKDPRKGRIKEMDMIVDFIALQWHVWDSIASIENPLDGVDVGDSWQTTQIIPLPIAIQAIKDTTYTLKEIDDSGEQRLAIIESTFGESKAKYENWPSRYKGRFRMKGMLGFLRGYRTTSLEGTGKQVFNVDAGTVISEEQNYKITMGADFMLPLGDMEPLIEIDQTISLRLMDN
jgi:hypothetical protein